MATGTFADGSTQDITSQVTWVSDAPDTAIFNHPGYSRWNVCRNRHYYGIPKWNNQFSSEIGCHIIIFYLDHANFTTKFSGWCYTTVYGYPGPLLTVHRRCNFRGNLASDTPWTATISSTGLATGVAIGTTKITEPSPK